MTILFALTQLHPTVSVKSLCVQATYRLIADGGTARVYILLSNQCKSTDRGFLHVHPETAHLTTLTLDVNVSLHNKCISAGLREFGRSIA